MASPTANFYYTILVLLLVSWITPSSAITKAEVSAVCSDPEIRDPSFCFSFFKNNPSFSPLEDFSAVAKKIAITTLDEAKQTSQQIEAFLKGHPSLRDQEILSECEVHYGTTIGGLQEVVREISGGARALIDSTLNQALSYVGQCGYDIQGQKYPFVKSNSDVANFIGILLSLNKHLK